MQINYYFYSFDIFSLWKSSERAIYLITHSLWLASKSSLRSIEQLSYGCVAPAWKLPDARGLQANFHEARTSAGVVELIKEIGASSVLLHSALSLFCYRLNVRDVIAAGGGAYIIVVELGLILIKVLLLQLRWRWWWWYFNCVRFHFIAEGSR